MVKSQGKVERAYREKYTSKLFMFLSRTHFFKRSKPIVPLKHGSSVITYNGKCGKCDHNLHAPHIYLLLLFVFFTLTGRDLAFVCLLNIAYTWDNILWLSKFVYHLHIIPPPVALCSGRFEASWFICYEVFIHSSSFHHLKDEDSIENVIKL